MSSALFFRRTAVSLAAILLSGCGPDTGPFRHQDTGTTTDPEIIREAIEFGGLVLPSQAQPLGARFVAGLDDFYDLAVATPPHTVDKFLADSRFTAPLATGLDVNDTTIDGYTPTNLAATVTGHDAIYPVLTGKQKRINRRVLVDRNNPASAIVHWWLFTT